MGGNHPLHLLRRTETDSLPLHQYEVDEENGKDECVMPKLWFSNPKLRTLLTILTGSAISLFVIVPIITFVGMLFVFTMIVVMQLITGHV